MFKNREQAAHLLAEKLRHLKGKNVLVFAIPRGAVVMGKIIASSLSALLDVIVVKKIGAPHNPELAIGAVGPEKVVYWDSKLCRAVNVAKKIKNQELEIKDEERRERERLLRGKKAYPNVKGKTVLVVDDGVATGATSIVAGKFMKRMGAKKTVLVTPVIAKDTLAKVKRYFDRVVYLNMPDEFHAVGQFYEEFPQVSDDEVIKILSN